jgi:hypothetical protein
MGTEQMASNVAAQIAENLVPVNAAAAERVSPCSSGEIRTV